MTHSPEPWRKVPENELGYCAAGPGIEDAQQNAVVSTVCRECLGDDERLSEANAERVVACVNACAGITTELLHQAARMETLIVLGSTKQLQDHLLNALDMEILPCCEHCGSPLPKNEKP